ncbi:deoxynucleoside triphosphate triphosphohydrolase SAMHD1-like [Littorina saxatilis]|uniref:HD domain-containing protein n=1 Tax=Littorina saxatilis TaxID=31220 RepID=A0AAN9BZW0_9CAEN
MSQLETMASEPKDCTEKVFNDPIHGNMGFPSLCVKIIDTPQFQRLRYLKQLGGGYFVYPDASHNRFEHSLGVCHLAGLLVTELRDRQPTLEITPQDVLCVQIAGLCHDLGHGPFSHVFDNKFIPAVEREKKEEREREREREKEGIPAAEREKEREREKEQEEREREQEGTSADKPKRWKHEDASLAMFDHMVKENKLEEDFGECHLTPLHRKFIKALIVGEPTEELLESAWDTKKKDFLFEIVANKRNGVDVDKWDYFQRDCHHLGMTSSFDLKRFIKFARVITDPVDGKSQICYRDKEAFNMYQLFHTRFTLHHRAYQHKTVQAVELMLVEAMREADKFLKIPGDDGKEWKISECIDHMDAYTKLTDNVIHQILLSKGEGPNSPEERAKKIVNDLQQRKLHKCVGEIVVPVLADDYMPKSEKSVKEEIEELILKKTGLDERIRIQVSKLDYGNEADNPVNDVRFWKKDKPDTAVPFKAVEVSFLVPQFCFMERLVRVFFKTGASNDKDWIENLQKVCRDWCDEQKVKRTEGEHADKFGKHASGTFYPTFH